MSDLTNAVLSHLDASHIDAIASQLGVEPAQAESAVQQAVALLMGGMAQNAATDEGAAALHGAVATHAGNDIGSLIGGLLGGGTSEGVAILGHVLGGRQTNAAQGLGQTSGIGTKNAGQLLAMVAPLVLSVIGNISRHQNMSAGGLGSVLGQESQSVRQGGVGGLLSSVLDQDGDGEVGLGDLLKVGAGLLGGNRGLA